MPRFAKRTDANQPEVVDTLRKHGFQAVITNMGNDFPDLLRGRFDKWMLLEVKTPDGCLDRGQLEFLVTARGPVDVVTSGIEATNAQGLTITERSRIDQWLVRNPTQNTLSVNKFRKIIGDGVNL